MHEDVRVEVDRGHDARGSKERGRALWKLELDEDTDGDAKRGREGRRWRAVMRSQGDEGGEHAEAHRRAATGWLRRLHAADDAAADDAGEGDDDDLRGMLEDLREEMRELRAMVQEIRAHVRAHAAASAVDDRAPAPLRVLRRVEAPRAEDDPRVRRAVRRLR